MGKVRFCEECGNKLAPGMKFCQFCGAEVPEENIPTAQEDAGRRQPEGNGWENYGGMPAERPAREKTGKQNKKERGGKRSPKREEEWPPQQEGAWPPQREGAWPPQDDMDMGNDWEQSWDRQGNQEKEHGFSVIQYVLIGLAVVLLIAMIVLGIILGTRILKKSSSSGAGSSGTGTVQSENQTAQTKQSESAAESEGAVTVQTDRQTEASQNIVLNYQEYTVTLPGSWKGKYGITQGSNYYSFYHQASKAAGYGGTLFTITRYTDTSYMNLPDYDVLGSGNGATFVFQCPTDVQFDSSNQSVAGEYQTMANDLDTIKNSVRILVSGSGAAQAQTQPQTQAQTQPQTQPQTQSSQNTAGTGGYIPESSQRLITDSDVAGMSYDDLQMAINEIYARHGRKFASSQIQSYFNSQPWYNGTIEPDDFNDSVFSSIENQNIQFLLRKMEVN